MASTFISLIGPDLVAGTTAPAGSIIVPNTSTSNTQTTLRCCYRVTQAAADASVLIQTGLPAQDGALGSFALTLTPAGDPANPADGAEVYARQLVAFYDPSNGELSVTENVAGADATYFVAVDLAHSVTR